MEISKTSQEHHFGETKKDTGLLFHIHVLNLFKSWSNLGFDQDSNGQKIKKKIRKNEKPKHIVFLCHIVSIQVDKQGLDIFKPEKSCIYPLTVTPQNFKKKKNQFPFIKNLESTKTCLFQNLFY